MISNLNIWSYLSKEKNTTEDSEIDNLKENTESLDESNILNSSASSNQSSVTDKANKWGSK